MNIVFVPKVTIITHEELVSVFSVLCSATDFRYAYNKKNYEQIPKGKRNGDSLEDKVADCLLNGFKVEITDTYADGEVHNENLEHVIDDNGAVTYYVGLQNFLDGFSNNDAMKKHLRDLIAGNYDYTTAYCLIQYVLFGKEKQ